MIYPEPRPEFEHTKYIVWVRHLGSSHLHADLENVTYAEAHAYWKRKRSQFGSCYILGLGIDPDEHHKNVERHATALEAWKPDYVDPWRRSST